MKDLRNMLWVGLLLAQAPLVAQGIDITTEHVSISIDKELNFQFRWKGDGPPITTDKSRSVLVVNGISCAPFLLDEKSAKQEEQDHSEWGMSQVTTLDANYQQGSLKIARQTRIILPRAFPDVVLIETKYTNQGKQRIHIDSVSSTSLMLGHDNLSSGQRDHLLASFQGGINEWGRDYALIWLSPGFEQNNFQGMHQTVSPERIEMIGGGMPFVDVWGKDKGVAIAHIEKEPQWVSLPVSVGADSIARVSIVEAPDESIGMDGWLEPGETFETVISALIFHALDFHDGLRQYGELLRQRGVAIPISSPEAAYEPYWKSWGFELDFTLEEIYGILPELKDLGIYVANLDDGWFDCYGDWNVNRSPGKFPGGEEDMIRFVDSVHQSGFRTNLWWYPLGVSLESYLVKNHADLLVMDKDGNYPLESRKLHQLCPAYGPAMDHVESLVKRFIKTWGYDGLYTDTRGLSAVPPCYNKKHKHKTPMESFQQTTRVFEVIDETLKKYNKEGLHEVCICAVPHSPYHMPYYQISSASDPVDLLQTRRRIKVEKAIHGPTYAAGDCYQVPDDEWSGFSVPQSFQSAVGTGGQVTTFYTDLDSTQYAIWKRWIDEYRNLKLSSADYTNLYDIAFDKPEVHVVKKEEELYYGFYADLWSKTDPIELRGLKQGIQYRVLDYANGRDLGVVNAEDPYVHSGFKEFLLLRVTPE
ncbi:MAG: alpha-galactosidase [Cyclobacteriaceae bacterium]